MTINLFYGVMNRFAVDLLLLNSFIMGLLNSDRQPGVILYDRIKEYY